MRDRNTKKLLSLMGGSYEGRVPAFFGSVAEESSRITIMDSVDRSACITAHGITSRRSSGVPSMHARRQPAAHGERLRVHAAGCQHDTDQQKAPCGTGCSVRSLARSVESSSLETPSMSDLKCCIYGSGSLFDTSVASDILL